jgi:two-component system, NtrC family, sensor kinase
MDLLRVHLLTLLIKPKKDSIKGGVMTKPTLLENGLVLNVGVVAKGENCLTIMRDLEAIKLSRLSIRLVAVAVTTPSVSCDAYAGEKGIKVFENYKDLFSLEYLDLVLELTGDPQILMDLIQHKPATIGILDQKASFLFLDISHLYDLMGIKDTEITLATSFASTLLEASPDGVLVLDRDYRIINSNNSPLVSGGLDRSAIIGKFCYEVMNQSPTFCVDMEACCAVQETIRTGRPARKVHDRTLFDGSPRICQITAYPIFNRLNEMLQFVITVRDMTQELSERILLQTEAIKKDLTRVVKEDRLASLGRLVASVCHEINNPITSIVTFTKLVLSYLKEKDSTAKPPDLERYLELSFREALRCGGIVKNLLTFARQDNVEAANIDIIEMVNTISLLTSHQLQLANVGFSVDLPSAPFTAWGDYGQIQQCLLNLIFNAIDAMPAGGSLFIKGKEEETGDFIWLEVKDTGQGIDPEHLHHIFEPFFTTKNDGKGVGLGLAMVYGIIHEHQGLIEVDSTPKKGTTFRLKLPKSPIEERKGAAV